MKIYLCPSKINPDDALASSGELTENLNIPMLAALSFVTGYELGNETDYLTSIINGKDTDELEYGESVCIFSPTGSGKTKAIEQISSVISKSTKTIILTNRYACKIQLIKDLAKLKNIPDELIDKLQLSENIEVMTYQDFARKKHKYQGKKLVLICDECHCFAEDSTFSVYPQQMVNFLRGNLDNTKRLYITATPDDVLSIIWNIEALSDKNLYPLMNDNFMDFLRETPTSDSTRIKHTYIMKSDWNYITFKVYDPDNRETLIKYLNGYCSDGKKALIFINDLEVGADMQQQLCNSQHIYSDEDKKAEIQRIALKESFDCDALITTKVAENGLSLHDENLYVIVAETYDPVVLQQVIGRARVNRRNPREIVVLIPDYGLSHLGSIEGKLYMQLTEFKKVIDNPDFAMQYLQQPNPYIYYDAILKKPVINHIGYQQIQTQLNYTKSLKANELEKPHAHVHKVLELYGKPTDNIEELFIDYDNTKDCKMRITSAWSKYRNSDRDAQALKILKEELKTACNETGAYPKELKSNIQIDTVNDILLFAGINEIVLPEIRKFEISDRNAPGLVD